jgi:hypothetical protein
MFDTVTMIFPSLKGKIFGYVNLNMEAAQWCASKNFKYDRKNNPLLDPKVSQEMVDDTHKKYALDLSYGGWMEDRNILCSGTYLEKTGAFIHLGVDINVPAGTEVATDFKASVVKIDDDYPEEGGWGPRVILKHSTLPIYMIYAHLDREIKCTVGDVLEKGHIFAKVGKPPYNGGWFTHCHIQSISSEYYDELEKNDSWQRLDGYGSTEEIGLNAERFRDPLGLISLTA